LQNSTLVSVPFSHESNSISEANLPADGHQDFYDLDECKYEFMSHSSFPYGHPVSLFLTFFVLAFI